MARTAEGAALTQAHRQGQLQIRARTLQDFIRIWPLWEGDEASFQRLLQAALPLVRSYHGLSAALAASYYQTFRSVERAGGDATPRLAAPPDEERVLGTLHLLGADMARRALQAGHSPQAAMQTALVRTSGAATRFVLDGGRDTVILSSGQDRRARGWARVTAGRPCAFCAILASRGPVYSEDTADFQAHDHCSCAAEPAYDGSEWPGRGREFRDMYDQAVRDARADGDLKRDTTNDALNAFRRSLA